MFHTLAEAKNRHHLGEREPKYRIAGERVVARGADAVIAASESERDTLIEEYGVSPNAISVIPCGVDTEMFRPSDTAAQEAGPALHRPHRAT